MLKDLNLTQYTRVFLRCGYTDMRKGLDYLVNLIQFEYGMDPYDKHMLFLFCGRNAKKIKAICWEGDGWVCLTKALAGQGNRFHWPRNTKEARALTADQFRLLMSGYTIEGSIHEVR